MKYVISYIVKHRIHTLLIYSVLLISSFNIILNFFEKVVFGERFIFADFSVYRCGAITFLNNINPYKPNALSECLNSYPNALDFFYPPFTLNIFSMFSNLTKNNAVILWTIIILPIFLFNIFLNHKLFFKNKNFFLFLLFYFFSFGGLNFTGLLTGNITIILYALLGVSFYYTIEKEKSLFIFFALIILCLFKITYLVFLILFFFLESKKYLRNSLLSISAITMFYLVSYFNNPKFFLDFLNHLTYLRSSEFFNLYGGGFGLYSIIKGMPELFYPGVSENYKFYFQFVWVLLCGSFMSSMIFLLYIKKKKFSKLQTLSFGILTITICYPLLKDYEGFLLVPVIYYLLFNLNFKSLFKKSDKNFKYILIFCSIAIHDKYMLFFTAIIIFFLILYIDYKDQEIFKKE
tara:strand:- start:110 stop:1324 length:1215 start_codon:yes stop_codon:yes gene_type:complete